MQCLSLLEYRGQRIDGTLIPVIQYISLCGDTTSGRNVRKVGGGCSWEFELRLKVNN